MSLYNMLFGRNQNADALLAMLGITASDVPRYRDCYLSLEGGKPRIVIHTRTGGGNRDYYENAARRTANFGGDEPTGGPWNDDLRRLPGFLYDQDDDFDSTYANFFYAPPADAEKKLAAMPADLSPAEKWRALFAAMQHKEPTK